MMVFSVLASSAGAVAAVLSFSSISNMVQMHQSVKEHYSNSNAMPPCSLSNGNRLTREKQWKSVNEGLLELQKMSRRQLIQLFLECESEETLSFYSGNASKETSIYYDGYLLDNGPVLSRVTNFITNTLFGRGQQWLGKVYFQPDGKDAIRMGKNRFICKEDSERLDRTFDCYIGPSATSDKTAAHQRTVIINDYAKRCPKWYPSSLIWGGMVDELRVIRLSKKKGDVILLGMGYFNWSGGVWNSAPFCLVQRSSHNSKEVRKQSAS